MYKSLVSSSPGQLTLVDRVCLSDESNIVLNNPTLELSPIISSLYEYAHSLEQMIQDTKGPISIPGSLILFQSQTVGPIGIVRSQGHTGDVYFKLSSGKKVRNTCCEVIEKISPVKRFTKSISIFFTSFLFIFINFFWSIIHVCKLLYKLVEGWFTSWLG